jgi:PAS domain S-box-containing protein
MATETLQEQNTEKSSKRSFWKRIFYYYRIDFTTIQGRLTGGFMSMAVISFILIMGANYQWGLMTKNREYVLQTARPIKLYSIGVMDRVYEAQVSFEKALLFNNEEYLKEYDEIWAKNVKANRDSLDKYIQRLEDNNATVLFAKIDNEISNLKREFEQVRAIYIKRGQIVGMADVKGRMQRSLQTDIMPLVAELEKSTNEMVFFEERLEEKYQKSYDFLDSLRPWVVFIEFMLAVAVAATIGSVLILIILKRVRLIRDNLKILVGGNIPDEIRESGDELSTIIRALNELSLNLKQIKNFAIDVGNGKFDTEISVFNNQGELGVSLEEMKQSLKIVYANERLRAFATEGLAKFSDILRKNNDNLDLLCYEIIANLVKYLEINQGGIFLLNKNEKEPYLELKAAYAFNKKKTLEKKILLGEGLLGQSFLEGGVVHIKKIPKDYISLQSGLGEATPKSLLIIPLMYNTEAIGVLELASFEGFTDNQIEFLSNLAEVIASTITSVNTNDATRRLLEESKIKTEAIQAQEEELRQNAEELVATQEELERKLSQTEQEVSRLKIFMNSIAWGMLVYNERGNIQFANKVVERMFGYNTDELVGLNVQKLFDSSTDNARNTYAGSRITSNEKNPEQGRTVQATRKNELVFDAEIYLQGIEIGREKMFVATVKSVS